MQLNKVVQDRLSARGIEKTKYLKPIDNFLSRIGFVCRPMVFWNSWILFTFWSIFFGTAMFMTLCFPFWKVDEKDFAEGVFISICAGITCGVYMAFKTYYERKKLGIPAWDILSKE